jgi:uncharacterized membrane protein
MTAIGYVLTQARIIAVNGRESPVARAVGSDGKGKLSLSLYAAGIAFSFVAPFVADAIYVAIAILWLVPDRRIERELQR